MVLIAGVAAVLAVLLISRIIIGDGPDVDARNCVGTPDMNTVVVIDHSEKVSTQTMNEIRARAQAFIRDSAVQNELVSIFTVSDLSKDSLVPRISLCRPARLGNRIFQNVKTIEKQFLEKFQAPLDSALRDAPGNTQESPIAQALIDISVSQYLKGSKNTLLIFSDMLENTKAFKLYGCEQPENVISQFSEFRKGAVERPSFKNTRVVLNLIPRLGLAASTLKCRDTLWVWFFGDSEGRGAGLEINYLPGGTPLSSSTRSSRP